MQILKFMPMAMETSGDISLEENVWTEIPTDSNDFDMESMGYFLAPIIRGKNLHVEMLYEGEIKLTEKDYLPETSLVTYPESSVLFGSRNLKKVREDSTLVFMTEYSSSENFDLPSLKFVHGNMPYDICENYINSLNGSISIFNNIKSDKKNLEKLLKELYEFVAKSSNRNEHDDNKVTCSMPCLIEDYLATGTFRGSCKSVSTFFVGLANAANLASRRVSGYVVGDTPFYTPNGASSPTNMTPHVWPEVYIPINKIEGFWIPVDPAGTKPFKHFPTGEKIYHFQTRMPHFRGPKTAKIKVQYV